MKNIIIDLIKDSLYKINKKNNIEIDNIEVNLCKDKKFGDFSSNIAMKYASENNEQPRDFAKKIINSIENNSNILKIEIAGPGFINFFIKNIFTILLLIFIYRNVNDKKESNFLLLLNGYLIISVLMFSLLPIATNSSSKQVSSYSTYVNEDFYINDGKKILCFFDAGCEHCMDAAKSLTEIANNSIEFPDVHIIFSDTEEGKIPDFLKYSGKEYSYQIMEFYNPDDEINSYLEVLGYEYENPVVIYYNNGNQMRFYDGTGTNEYDAKDFESLFN